MDANSLQADYRMWLRFQRQEQLGREHRAAVQKLAETGAMASRVTEAYRSMADRAAKEGASYRTLFQRQRDEGDNLACEGWLFVRRVLAEGGTTRIRATLFETFTLEDGEIQPSAESPKKITLDIYDELLVSKSMKLGSRADRQDDARDTRFITFLDSVRGDLRQYL
ncbi:hypothetical protein [Salinicola halophilus]|uniref:hypothetical protein n=1 Tax=Salinicola halophilus TaxID=184065 RepID=UPI000DA1430A|nr:hypothetical protein [Salinicola halophilus]